MKDHEQLVVSCSKSALRRQKIEAREALSEMTHQRLSAMIDIHLRQLLANFKPTVLGFYWPFRKEFDCRPLMIEFIQTGIRCCLPCIEHLNVDRDHRVMTFVEWHPDDSMVTDRYGISYPLHGNCLFPDILLIPVNAFDSKGYRLGYGSGYFDRTLSAMSDQGKKPLAIGIGFELSRVISILPEPYDMPLDVVVTEAGIFGNFLQQGPSFPE